MLIDVASLVLMGQLVFCFHYISRCCQSGADGSAGVLLQSTGIFSSTVADVASQLVAPMCQLVFCFEFISADVASLLLSGQLVF